MGSVGCLAKSDIFFWQTILKKRSKYRGDISEQSVVCTVLISAIIIEILRKNRPISYRILYKKLASPLIPVCLKKSHMGKLPRRLAQEQYGWVNWPRPKLPKMCRRAVNTNTTTTTHAIFYHKVAHLWLQMWFTLSCSGISRCFC